MACSTRYYFYVVACSTLRNQRRSLLIDAFKVHDFGHSPQKIALSHPRTETARALLHEPLLLGCIATVRETLEALSHNCAIVMP